MASPYVGEIRMFAGNFAPVGWMFCNGQVLSITQYETLFNLIGATYGGDGQTTFALPNLQSRVPLHMGASNQGSFVIGQFGGEENVTLNANQLPPHSHLVRADANPGTATSPAGNLWAASSGNPYAAGPIDQQMAAGALGPAGGDLPHENMIPFLGISFIISLFGIFPSRG